MEQTVTLQLSHDEALQIIVALGTFQNRIGQHSSWAQRKRIPKLEEELKTLPEGSEEHKKAAKQLEWSHKYIRTCIADGRKCYELKERIKVAAGIEDEETRAKVRSDLPLTINYEDMGDFYYMVRWFSKEKGNTFHYLWNFLKHQYPQIAQAYGDTPED